MLEKQEKSTFLQLFSDLLQWVLACLLGAVLLHTSCYKPVESAYQPEYGGGKDSAGLNREEACECRSYKKRKNVGRKKEREADANKKVGGEQRSAKFETLQNDHHEARKQMNSRMMRQWES